MALILSLLRRTHLLSRQDSSGPVAVAAGWLGSVQLMCRGLVLGIIGVAASCLASLVSIYSIFVWAPQIEAGGEVPSTEEMKRDF
jgi:hypothetical protein